MLMYENLSEGVKSAASLNMNRGEAYQISRSILYQNKIFYIVEYNKTLLGIKFKNVSGRLAVDDQGDVVNSKAALKELGRLFYYYDIFFMNRGTNLKGLIKSDEEIKRETRDYISAVSVLEYMESRDIQGASAVKEVVAVFPELKKESNDILISLSDKVKMYNSQDAPISKAVIDELYTIYQEAMLSNFKRIKFLNNASEYYDSIMDQAVKIRRSAGLKLDQKTKNKAMKLESIISFFINIIKFYGNTINYSMERYIGTIADKESKEIEVYVKSFRNLNVRA